MSPTQRGFLLLETLTGILLFSVGVLGTVATQAHAFRHIDEANSRSVAAHLAQSLVARMWADDIRSLAERYDKRQDGEGYREFAALGGALPGAALAANAPDVTVESGPSSSSRKVTITLHWRLPGDRQSHRYSAFAVIGHN